MQLQPYLAIRHGFDDLSKSEFYNQVIDDTMASLKKTSDLLDPFHTMDILRIEYVMKYFIFHMNLISDISTFAFSLITTDDGEAVTAIQLFSIK